MNKQEVLEIVNAHQNRLNDFAVKELFLFGSVARGEETENSDVDFLVSFGSPCRIIYFITFKGLFRRFIRL